MMITGQGKRNPFPDQKLPAKREERGGRTNEGFNLDRLRFRDSDRSDFFYHERRKAWSDPDGFVIPGGNKICQGAL